MKLPVKHVPWSMFVGGLLDKLLSELFCSAAWLKACVTKVRTAQGDRAYIDVSTYPPGGAKGTGMVYCARCRRWAPRDMIKSLGSSCCLDCLTERDDQVFTQRLKTLSDPTFIRELERLYRHRVPSGLTMVRPERFCPDLQEEYDLNSNGHEVGYRMLGADFWDAYDRHHRWVGKDTAPAALPSSLLQDIQNPDSVKGFARRCLGCQTVLLSEDEVSLKQEITDYLNTQTLRPSVTQNGSVNPFQFTPRRKQRDRFETETLGTRPFHWAAC